VGVTKTLSFDWFRLFADERTFDSTLLWRSEAGRYRATEAWREPARTASVRAR
jgi:hypothetical protein